MSTDAAVHGITGYRYASAGAREHHSYNVPTVVSLLPSGDKLRVLDAGCGSGYLANELAKLGHDVVGIDISDDGIELAKATYPQVRFYNRSVFEEISDIRPSGGFDVVVSSEVIEHLYAPQKFLLGMFGALRPGGTAIVTTPYYGYAKNLMLSLTDAWDRHHMVGFEGGHIKLFSKASLFKMMNEAGFEGLVFKGGGRLPFLWKSMIVAGRKPPPPKP